MSSTNHETPQASALKALNTLRDLDLAFLDPHYETVLEVRQKLGLVKPKSHKESTDLPRTLQSRPKNARKLPRLMRKDSETIQRQPCPPQPHEQPYPSQPMIVPQLMKLLDDSRVAIIDELTDPAVEAAITSLPEYVGEDPRFIDLMACTLNPVARGKRLHARRWIATCYKQWLEATYGRNRVDELLNDPRGKPRPGTPEEFLNSGQCQLKNTVVAKRGLLEGLKVLVLERLCGCDTISAIVNYHWICIKDINMSALQPLSLAIKSSGWMMAFVQERTGWLANCQARYDGEK